ncbi:MAG: 6-phosphogluconolactonase [Tannerella sp.]|jgi:6-phosphogluconolactonase|nr:6-phosphogluconolactonase [Tannerella sp.]
MNISVYPTPLETARELIVHIIEQLNKKNGPFFNIAFSGGNGPLLMFKLWLEEYKNQTPWEKMCVYWVDERCVPADSSESNYGMMHSLLLNHVPVPNGQIFPIQGENEPVAEALRYSELVRKGVSLANDLPVFDLVLLGAGTDGHTSSIFPGQEYLLTSSQVYAPSEHPVSRQKRIALTGQPIIHAKETIFLITGEEKTAVVADIFHSSQNGPAAYIAHYAKNASLYLDSDAAASINH